MRRVGMPRKPLCWLAFDHEFAAESSVTMVNPIRRSRLDNLVDFPNCCLARP